MVLEPSRTIEYWDYDLEEWIEIEWPTVASGMMVRMFEEDGTPVLGSVGTYEMNVISDSYLTPSATVSDEEVWTINIEDPSYPLPKRAQ